MKKFFTPASDNIAAASLRTLHEQSGTQSAVDTAEDAIIAQEPPAHQKTDSPEFEVSYVATPPEVTNPGRFALSFTAAHLGIKKLSINKGLQDWMDYDVRIRNWVYTAITGFMAMNLLEWDAPVPDQFRDEMGVGEITIERFERAMALPVRNEIPMIDPPGTWHVHVYA